MMGKTAVAHCTIHRRQPPDWLSSRRTSARKEENMLCIRELPNFRQDLGVTV